ncbi:helix-turn-helix domain-containing protein [Cytobacillus suaedae]|nr:helix-turn-helix domain-containing protein [Cytobacillus suaedae]
MEGSSLGALIKDLRKHMGLTQQELADNICTQAQISKLENGSETPSSFILYELSKKLGVDMNYFFEMTSTPRIDYVHDVFDQIRHHINQREYKEVDQIIHQEKHSPLFSALSSQQFMLWHEAICDFYIRSEPSKSIQKLNIALTMVQRAKHYSERQIQIITSRAIIYNEIEAFERSIELFEEAHFHLKKLIRLKDPLTLSRILYGYSKSLSSIGKYDQSISVCTQGISYTLKHESLYLLGEFFYQKGLNFKRLGLNTKAISFFEKARATFNLQNQVEFEEFIRCQIKLLSPD